MRKKYLDEDAAMQKKASPTKKPLTSSPFVVDFYYGAQDEGYWCYEHMVLQLEDCIYCLHVLNPEFDYLFLFDHSCGHNQQRDEGLNAVRMAKGFGGKQAKLHNIKIKEEKGYLSTYHRKLQPGDVQKMVLGPDDVEPCWMTAEECEA
jgi:hypothetical protein